MGGHHDNAARMIRVTAAQAVVALAVAAAFATVYFVRYALCALLGAAVIGIALRPLIEWLTRRGLSRRVANASVFAVLACVTIAGLVWLAPLAGRQLSTLAQTLPDQIARLDDRLVSSRSGFLRGIGALFSPWLQSHATVEESPVLVLASSILGDALRGGYVALLILVMAAMWNDASRAARIALRSVVATARGRRIASFLDEAEAKLGAYVRGQLIVCALSATIGSIAYLSLGLPYAVLLGLVTGTCEIVPLIGPISAGLGVLAITAFTVPIHLPWIFLILTANHLCQTYVVTPRVMDRTVGVTPFAVLFSVVMFSALLGLPGGVLAVPMAAVLQVVLDRFVLPVAREPAPVLRTHAEAR